MDKGAGRGTLTKQACPSLGPLRWISPQRNPLMGITKVMRSAVVSFFRRRRRFLFAWQTIPSGTTCKAHERFEKRSFEKRVSAPCRTSKHGFEKRSFEKPLSAPYSFLNKAHFLVLIPAVLKTIARFKKSRALALLTLFPFWRVKYLQLSLDL